MNAALAANDRLKYGFSLLRLTAEHAQHPRQQAGETAAGIDKAAGASSMVFADTSVISGKATILRCRAGADTALGQLARSLAESPPATDSAADCGTHDQAAARHAPRRLCDDDFRSGF